MKINLYYPDGSTQVVEHYNPMVRGSKLDGVRAQAIVIELSAEDKLDEDFFLTVASAVQVVALDGFVGLERV